MAYERLDKIIASMGQFSRKEVKKLVRDGLVSVDGETAKASDMKCDPLQQVITVNGRPLEYEKDVYLMLNKPAGVVTATRDDRNRTVMDLLPAEYRGRDLFPVGRLDKDTEGLLLITNDGSLAHRLLSPGRHVDKEYLVTVEGPLDEEAVKAFAEGIVLADGSQCMPASLQILKQKMYPQIDENITDALVMNPQTGITITEAKVIIQEGMYHQIKRMFGTLDRPVVALKRIRMGSLVLDETLQPGEIRPLTQDEINTLTSPSVKT